MIHYVLEGEIKFTFEIGFEGLTEDYFSTLSRTL